MITLNDVKIPDFVKVNNVGFSVLPPISNNLLSIRGKYGVFPMSQDVDVREFTITFTIVAEEINGVMGASRDFANWLYHKEPVKMVFDDEPDKYYLVLPEGDSNVTEMVNIGQGEITFICIEPFAYGETKEHSQRLVAEGQTMVFDVDGTVETHPTITMNLLEDITSITVESGDNAVTLGEHAEVTQTPKNPVPLVFKDTMQTMDNWSQSGAYSIDSGVKAGEYTNTTHTMAVKDKDYGTGERWHGAVADTKLDKPVEDFSVYFRLDARPKSKKEMGRMELYLIDEDGNHFGKIALVDIYKTTDEMKFEARAGTWEKGTYFLNSRTNEYSNRFYGRMLLTREGRMWTISVSDTRVDGKFMNEILYATWFDSEDVWSKHKLSKIQVHTGAYGDNPHVNTMLITHIEVKERLTLEDNQVPIIAVKDDEIVIDNEKMIVYLNEEPRYDLINPSSNFIKLENGENTLTVTPTQADVNVEYVERWL